MRRTPATSNSLETERAPLGTTRPRFTLMILLAFAFVLSACGGSGSEDTSNDASTNAPEQSSTDTPVETTGDLESVATLTVDGEPYTFAGVRGGSVLNDDFYCFVGTSGGINATLALEGDTESELRFIFLPDESEPGAYEANVTAVLPQDFDHTLRDGGQTGDIEIQDISISGDSFTVSATIAMEESGSGDEHEGTLEASC